MEHPGLLSGAGLRRPPVAVGLLALAVVALLFLLFVLPRSWVEHWAAEASVDVWLIVRWWAILSFLGLLVSPMTRGLTAHLPDRGIALNRGIGLMLVTSIAWLSGSAHALPYSHTSAWVWVALLAVVTGVVVAVLRVRMSRPSRDDLGRWAAAEAVFLGLLYFYVQAVMHNDLTPLHHGDQGLDSAVVNAIGRSEWFPPFDPWFAGFPLNYYYLGHLSQSLLGRLTATPFSVAYSMGMATVMALMTSICLATGWAITRRWWGGALAALGVGLAGNFHIIAEALQTGRLEGLDWRATSGLVAMTFTDPPFVTFTRAELHAQFLALSALAVAFGAMYAFATIPGPTPRLGHRMVDVAIVGLAAGMPGVTNLYSLPAALGSWGLLHLALWLRSPSKRVLFEGAIGVAVSVLGYLPFFLTYHGSPRAAVVPNAAPTPPYAIIMLFGMLVGPLACWAFASTSAIRPTGTTSWRLRLLVTLGEVVAAGLLARWVATSDAKQIGPGLALYAALLLICIERSVATAMGRGAPAQLLAWVSGVVAFGLLVLIELVSLDVPTLNVTMRFNIVWKTYLSIWVPLSLAAALATSELLTRSGPGSRGLARLAGIVSVCLFVLGGGAGLLYSYNQASSWRENVGLDGLGYVHLLNADEKADFEAVAWLNAHAADHDVELEAAGGAMHPYGRISSYTGLATVLGWMHAVDAWQGSPPTLKERFADVEAIYRNANPAQTRQLLRKYHVRYIVIGHVEADAYSRLDRAGLQQIAPLVFESGNTQVLRVPDDVVLSGL